MATRANKKRREQVEAYYDRFLANWDSEAWDPRTLERVELARPRMLPSGSLLVVGLGSGAGAKRFREWGYDVTILDVSPAGVKYARELGLKAIQADLETDELTHLYDQIVCFEVLEHLRDPATALEKLRAALKPGGQLFVSLPNEFHIVRRFQILIGRVDFAQYDWPHLRFFDIRECKRLFQNSELEIRKVVSMPLVPPRMKALRKLGRLLCWMCPTLFAVSYVFHLRPVAR